MGLAGSGASGAFPAAQFELIAGFALLLLGWLFVPFYLRSGVFTMPEFLEARYSSGVRFYLAAISIVGYVLTKISVTIAAGGIVFEALMGIDFWTGAVIVVLATGVYTVIGGMRAVLVLRHVPNVRDDRRRRRRHDRRPRTLSAAGASCARPRRRSS